MFGGLGNMFGGGGSQQQPQYQAPPQQAPAAKVSMKGPSDVEELMREFEMSATFDNDRIETMSAITESEIGEILDDDASSINGLLMGKKKKAPVRGKGKRTLNI
jgi:hypothetical protein